MGYCLIPIFFKLEKRNPNINEENPSELMKNEKNLRTQDIEKSILVIKEIEKKHGSLEAFWQKSRDQEKNTQDLMHKQEPFIKRVIERRKAEFMKI
jgi:hypothetical protein